MSAESIGRQELLEQISAVFSSSPGGALSLVLVEIRPPGDEAASWDVGTSDALLDRMLATAQQALEGGGIARRTGGETLAIILPGAEPLFARVAVDDLVGRLRSASLEVVGAESVPRFVVGLASLPQDGRNVEDINRAARAALRASRRISGGGVVTAQEALSNPSPEDVLIGNLPPAEMEARTEAIQSLDRRVDATRGEAGAMVFIRGEPGIGKATLLGALLERLPDDVSILSTRLDPTSPYKPYEALARAVEDLVTGRKIPPKRLVRGMDEEQKQALAVVLPSMSQFTHSNKLPCQASLRRGLFQAFAGLLEQLGPQEMLVFAVTNAQWMDAASLELVSYLIRSRRLRVLLVGTVEDLYTRGYGNQPFAVTELIEMAASIPFLHVLRLARLSATETGRLVEDLLPGAGKGELHRLVERNASGIPFGVISVLRLLAPRLQWDEENGLRLQSDPSVPRTLNGQVEATLEALPRAAARAMAALAVCGRPSDAETISGVLESSSGTLLDVLETLHEDAFLSLDGGKYWFTAEHYFGVSERLLGPEAAKFHRAGAERAESGASELAMTASEDAVSAYNLLRRQAYALFHRAAAGDSEMADRLKSGLKQTSRLLYSPGEADEYMGGGAAQPPAPQRATFEERDMDTLSEFLNSSLEALASIQQGASSPLEVPVKAGITAAMEDFFAENENLTLSFREGIPRACGQPLSARRYGDSPSLLGQFIRARGVAVVCIDFRTKIDEWLWFLVGLGHEPNRISAPGDWPYWLRDKGVRFISVEPGAGFSGSPPVLAHSRRQVEAPPVTGARSTSPVKHRRSGKARSALFDTSVSLEAQPQSAEVSKILSEAGVPLGISAIKPGEKVLKASLAALGKLVERAHPSQAAGLIERLASGLELAEQQGRTAFYKSLVDIVVYLRRIPDRALHEKLARLVVRQVEKEQETDVLTGGIGGLTGFVCHLVETGHSDLGRPLLVAMVHKGAPLRQSLAGNLAGSDLLELVTTDLSSEDPLRQADVAPVAEILAQLLPARFVDIILNSQSYRVRKAAARAVAMMEAKEREALAASALASAQDEARARLVEVLDVLGLLKISELPDLMFDEAEPVRAAAAALTERLSESDIEELLASVEKEKGIETALRTAVHLASGGSTTVVLKAVVHNDIRLQKAAAGALGILTRRGAIPPRRALEALDALAKKAERAFRDESQAAAGLGSAVIKALSLNPLPEAQKAISAFTEFPDPEVAAEARRTLGEDED